MQSKRSGYLMVVAAYTFWGLLPIFWAQLSEVSALTVLFQRTLWSAVFLALVLGWRGELGEVFKLIRSRRYSGRLLLSTSLLAVNWFSYLLAIQRGELFAAGLAYYLCPILTILAAALILRESLAPSQWLAVAIFMVAVVGLAVMEGMVPWMALIIGGSWSAYTLLQRGSEIPSLQALFCQTALLSLISLVAAPFAFGMESLWPAETSIGTAGLFVLAGFVTASPILVLMQGMKRVPFKVVGVLQYSVPTLTLACSILYFERHLTEIQLLTVALIWAGILTFFLGGKAFGLARGLQAWGWLTLTGGRGWRRIFGSEKGLKPQALNVE